MYASALNANSTREINMKQDLIAAAVSVGLGLGIASVANASPINIQPQGTGPAISVSALDFAPGNAICTPSTGVCIGPQGGPTGVIQVFGHGELATFNNAAGQPIAAPLQAYEWTYLFGFQELATPVGPNNSNFTVVPGGSNFFQIFYDATRDSDPLTGLGFGAGGGAVLILAGTVTSGSGTFAATQPPVILPLDTFNTNNYPGITTLEGEGSTDFTTVVSFFNPSFFPDGISGLQIFTDTFQNTPYVQTNPSACFQDGAVGGAGGQGTACLNSVGTINGVTGPNTMFQTDATSSFVQAVPEPGSLVLMALGLLSLAGVSRRKIT